MTDLGAYELATVKRNQVKMVARRGYDLPDHEKNLDKLTDRQLVALYAQMGEKKDLTAREAMSGPYAMKRPGERDRLLYVMYAAPSRGESAVGTAVVADFTKLTERMEGLTDAILVSSTGLTTPAAKNFPKNRRFQHFVDQELMFDVTEHVLVPKHEALTREQQEDFYRRNEGRIKPNELPIIKYLDVSKKVTEKNKEQFEDPVCKYYGWQPGQVVKVYRTVLQEGLVKTYPTYRVVG